MKRDFYRVVLVLVLSSIPGLLFGNLFFWLFLGLFLYVLWYLKSLNYLLSWMRKTKQLKAPEISGLIEDISSEFDYLRARHKKRKKKLTQYLKRFRETTQALPDGIVVLGKDNEIEWANGKAMEYLGVRYPLDTGQRITNLVRHPGLVEFLAEENDFDQDSERIFDIVSPLNKAVHLELRRVSFGKTGTLLVARDITEIYRINKMRSDFIANASHELRTPLTVISGYLESFEDEMDERGSENDNTRIRHMRSQADRMRRLIEDLLKLSSLETTDETNITETVRVPGLITRVVEEASAISGERRHKFRLEVDKDLWLKGDRNQIYSAISNVVNNAVQHTPDKGTITIKWHELEGSGLLDIEDTGEGINPEHIPRLTERFYRVDRGRSRDKGGTGLGLAIVKHILARHKAKLEVESEPGKGSLFRLKFPKSHLIHKDIIHGKSRAEGELSES